ncbi:MAG: penicillin-binding protein 1A [Myxococcota bacterium]
MARNKRRSSGKLNKKKSKGGFLMKLIKWLFIGALICGVLGAGGVAGIFYFYGRDLPKLLEREDYQPNQMSRVYSTNDEVIGEFVVQGGRRTVVPLEEIPETVRYAFMAAEDADFMAHEGIDYLGMVRAFYYAIVYDAGLKGTSTITQQVIKNLVLTPERKIERKVKEIILARELEKNLSKEDILYLYLNEIYLGHGNHGVQEAAQFYFGKPASELEIHEAAVLAGITQSPETLSPKKHPERALKRRSFVLKQLWEKGFIEEAAYRSATEKPLETVAFSETFPHLGEAPFFVEFIRKKVVEKYGKDKVFTDGMSIHTTLDLKKQRAAIASVRDGLRTYDARKNYYEPQRKLEEKGIDPFIEKQSDKIAREGISKGEIYEAVVTAVDPEKDLVKLSLGDVPARLLMQPRSRILGVGEDEKKLDEAFERGHVLEVVPMMNEPDDAGSVLVRFDHGPEGAIVSIEPKTREVVAMTGGYDFDYKSYDHATQARRQTGSTFKPFVYGAAIEGKVITPATIYLDSPAVFKLDGGKSWSPKNSDGSWRGPIRIREGLGASRNVVAVRVLKDIGIEKAQDFARKVGIKSPMVDNFTMVMGSSELTPLEITNAFATFASGGFYAEPRFLKRVETASGETDVFDTQLERVLAPEVAYLVTDLMTSVTMGYVDSEGRRRGGTASSLNKLGRPIAGKTGTTNETRDGWFIGFTPQYVTGTWVGFDDNRTLGRREYGGRVAGPIWKDYMKDIHEDLEVKEFEPPASGISKATIDPATGKLVREGGVEEVFLSGTAPTEYAPMNQESGSDDFLMNQFGSDEDESGDEAAAAN